MHAPHITHTIPKPTLTSNPTLPQYVSLRRVRISRSVRMGRFSLRKPAMFHVPRKNLHTNTQTSNTKNAHSEDLTQCADAWLLTQETRHVPRTQEEPAHTDTYQHGTRGGKRHLLGESTREKGNKHHIRGGMKSEGGVGVTVSACCAQRDCTQTHHTGRQGWASTAWLAARVWSQGTHRSVGLTNVCLRKADAQTKQTCP